MDVKARQILILKLDDDLSPFEDWVDSLGDSTLIRAIDSRITRVRDGNFGDHKGSWRWCV